MAVLGSAIAMNSGRILVYALMGAGLGSFGRGLQMAGMQRWVSILLGAVILLMLVAPNLIKLGPLARLPGGLIIRIQSSFAPRMRRTSPEGLFFTGMLNGLLPCGLVYLALAAAVTQNGWSQGALFMVFFGLGTWPALIGLKVGGGLIGPVYRRSLGRVAPYAYAVMAILFILRGLDLGIPFISPALQTVNSAGQECFSTIQ